MHNGWITVLGSLILILLICSISTMAQSDEFISANKFYEEKDYRSAVNMYHRILAQGVESETLYYNLGNACFKSGDLGHAILYYSRARRLNPADEDIIHNLQFAKQLSRVQMEGVQLNPIHTFLKSIVDPYRITFLVWLSSALFVLFMITLIIRFGLGIISRVGRAFSVAILVLLLVATSMTTFKYRVEYLTRRAVIIAEECPVYTGASDLSDITLQGAPGLIMEIVSENGDYYNVLFENKRRGWVKKELVAEI